MTQKRQKKAKLLTIFFGALFGWMYNRLIARLENPPFDNDALVYFEVVFGVAATIMIAALTGYISWRTAGRILVAFAATGTPMADVLRRDMQRKEAFSGRQA